MCVRTQWTTVADGVLVAKQVGARSWSPHNALPAGSAEGERRSVFNMAEVRPLRSRKIIKENTE